MRTLLTLNAGSSSLRFAAWEDGDHRRLEGKFDRLGRNDATLTIAGESAVRDASVATPRDGLPSIVALLAERTLPPPQVVAHRVVHGGPRHFDPTVVTPALLHELHGIESFAPNHLPAALALMAAACQRWPEAVHVACFDTQFHRDLPMAAQLLPLPRRYASQGIRRYGFHGLAYASVLAELRRRHEGDLPSRLILAHLGHGASLAVVRDGRCVDTTMGFTPLGGLVMSTRSGDLDPGVLAFIATRDRLSPPALERMLSSEAGLLGLSGLSSDTRELLAAEATDSRAQEALAVFVHQARKAIGAGAATLGGLDALVFSGGIGENSVELRARICAEFSYLGLELDPASNQANAPVFSSRASRVAAHWIHADEEAALASAARPFQAGGAGERDS